MGAVPVETEGSTGGGVDGEGKGGDGEGVVEDGGGEGDGAGYFPTGGGGGCGTDRDDALHPRLDGSGDGDAPRRKEFDLTCGPFGGFFRG